MSEQPLDVVIVGAGPAGLAAGNRCLMEGVSFIMIDEGKPIIDRSDSNCLELVSGVGGTGLFSDGKLSFYPSSHALWALPGERILKEAYGWLQSLTHDLVGTYPPFPTSLYTNIHQQPCSSNHFLRRDYISLKLDSNSRNILLHRLVTPINHRILSQHRVITITSDNDLFSIFITQPNGKEINLTSHQVILCPGRYGTQFLQMIKPKTDTVFRRFEYGVRIEQPSDKFFLKDDPSMDTKIILDDPGRDIEWRTFCCCRNGVIVQTQIYNLRTYSGTSYNNTNNSNIGFNCRILSASLYKDNYEEISSLLSGKVADFSVSIKDFCDKRKKQVLLGAKLDEYLHKGLLELQKLYNLTDATLYGPCIEGMGLYPKLTSRLETSVKGLYVAGDIVGTFRGLLPALLSGVYVGAFASKTLFSEVKQTNTPVQIKRSPIRAMPLVFTAQSKQFFYCRDAICEYVLKCDKLPINPFRVFDYFLGDRVDRDILRQGNNQLIRSSDELWVFGPVADGVLFELFHAAQIGKPIRFFSIGTRVSDIQAINNIEDIVFEPEVHAPQQSRKNLLRELQRLLDNSITCNNQPTLFDLL